MEIMCREKLEFERSRIFKWRAEVPKQTCKHPPFVFQIAILEILYHIGCIHHFFFNLPKREITIQKYILIPLFYILQLSSDLHKKRIDYVSSEYLYLCLTWIRLFGTSSFYTSGFFRYDHWWDPNTPKQIWVILKRL